MDILLKVFLPLSLAVIMFSLGLGLTVSDFTRILRRPVAFTIGAISQVVLIPLVAFAVVSMMSIAPELAVGIMILSFCPGGVTSNMLSKLANGDVALSITLTGVISLLSILTVPFLVAWSVVNFMGSTAPQVDVTQLAIQVFLITTVPVLLGILVRHFLTGFAMAVDRPLSMVSTILFVIIVLGALAANWELFIANLSTLGPALIAINVILLVVGWVAGKITGRAPREITTIAIETGIQNSTLGIAIGSLIVEQASGLPPFSLPAGVYGITMYFVALPFIAWRRSVHSQTA